jgi:hypothetical protein
MAERFHTIAAGGVTLTLDLLVGHIRALEFDAGGKILRPLHTAPWVDDPAVAADPEIPPNLKYLSGDFFCAPFSRSDVVPGMPSHGWPGNSPWTLVEEARASSAVTARFQLDTPVMGARLTKELTLRDGHPFVYQKHVFTGGSGAISAASHAMTRFANGGTLSFSPKLFGDLPDHLQESDPARGRSLFARGRRFTDLAKLPLADGKTADLHRYPVGERHEDFVMLVERPENRLGWTAAVRPDAGDLILSLKNPADFPVTFLWFSNGGRYYSPWNSRHLGVLGIEEGRAYSSYGHAASIAPNPLSEAGIPTFLQLGGRTGTRHVIGAVPAGTGWQYMKTIEPAESGKSGDGLTLTTPEGESVTVPFDTTFLAGPL